MGADFYDYSLGSPPTLTRNSRRATSVKNPCEFIIVADTAADGYGDLNIRPISSGLLVDDSIGSIHRGGANVLFCDGHVQWYLRKDVTVPRPAVPEDAPKQRLWNV